MEKRNWKHSVTLKQRMVLCLAAFFAAFALQLALNGYQARAVQQVQDDRWATLTPSAAFRAVWKAPSAFWKRTAGRTARLRKCWKASGSLLHQQRMAVAHPIQYGRLAERQR